MRMLIAAGIDPVGMITFFEMLRKEEGELPGFLKYLSTHPSSGDRIVRLRSLAARARGRSVKLLPSYDWDDIKKICQATGQPD